MKKERIKGFLSGVFATAIVFSVSLSVVAAAQNISVNGGMKITINGTAFIPTDANGKTVDVFEYNGTTYVPLRAMSQAFGKAVGYDAQTRTATISAPTPITLSKGQYTVGEDIPAGKYDVNAISGSGNFQGSVQSLMLGMLNEIMASSDSEFFANSNTYSNLKLQNGDTFTINGDLKLSFTAK